MDTPTSTIMTAIRYGGFRFTVESPAGPTPHSGTCRACLTPNVDIVHFLMCCPALTERHSPIRRLAERQFQVCGVIFPLCLGSTWCPKWFTIILLYIFKNVLAPLLAELRHLFNKCIKTRQTVSLSTLVSTSDSDSSSSESASSSVSSSSDTASRSSSSSESASCSSSSSDSDSE